MFKTLLAIRLRAFGAYFTGAGRSGGKKPSRGKKILFAVLMAYCVVTLAALMFGLFTVLADSFCGTDYSWLLFAVMAVLAFGLMFVCSVFMTKAQLFEATDNELLLSLPVKPSAILLSRMTVLFLFNLIFALVAAVPAYAAWVVCEGFSPGTLIVFLISIPALDLFALAFSGLIAWLIALLTARMQKKTLVSTLLSLLFVALYMLFVGRAQSYVTALAENGASVAEVLQPILPLYWLGTGIAYAEPLSALMAIGLMLAVFALALLLLSKGFDSITARRPGGKKAVYREKTLKVSSADGALLQKELRRFFSGSGYLLNAGFGLILGVAAAVLLPFLHERIVSALTASGIASENLTGVVIAAICFLNATCTVTACSVSLEGKSLWLPRSLPVSGWQVLNAKRKAQLCLSLPVTAVLSLSAAFSLGLDPVFTLLIPLLFALLMTDIGLWEGLRHPYFNWTNELQAVKQSMAVLFTLLLGMAIIGAAILLYSVLLRSVLAERTFFWLCLAALAVAERLLRGKLQQTGTELFETLD